MRKLGVFILGVSTLCGVFLYPNDSLKAEAAVSDKIVYVGGMSAGFTLKTGGVRIIGTCEIFTEDGTLSPAGRAGLRSGDVVTKAGGISVESVEELNEIVNKCGEKTLELEIKRGGDVKSVKLTPIKDKSTGKFRIGVLVRDSVSGIGTVTYIEKESGRFGSLGHAVEGENKREIDVSASNGLVYECDIVGVNKGVRGRAGELRGMFIADKRLGQAEKLCNCGIFGQISETFETKNLQCAVATSDFVKPGNAYIYSTVEGNCPKKYEIEIVKVDKRNRENKNYVIKITDEALIEETGGIVQGMSGSPILQDGKLVGAVTHVFLNDPTRGYGIDIATMLCE